MQPMDDPEVDRAVEGSEWRREGNVIVRTATREFPEAIRIIGLVGAAAERLDHHPDIELARHRHLTFRLWTWAAGGVTRHDLDLAREIDAILGGSA